MNQQKNRLQAEGNNPELAWIECLTSNFCDKLRIVRGDAQVFGDRHDPSRLEELSFFYENRIQDEGSSLELASIEPLESNICDTVGMVSGDAQVLGDRHDPIRLAAHSYFYDKWTSHEANLSRVMDKMILLKWRDSDRATFKCNISPRPDKPSSPPRLYDAATPDMVSSTDLFSDEPMELLDALDGGKFSALQQVKAILKLERVDTGSLYPRLSQILVEFVNRNHFSRDANTVTGVCSAIRKFSMISTESNLGRHTNIWLRDSETREVHADVELEIAKSVSARIQFGEITDVTHLQDLSETCKNIADSYLVPRILLRHNFAAISVNLIVLILLIDGISSNRTAIESIDRKLNDLETPWFRNLVLRRVKQALERLGISGTSRENPFNGTSFSQL